MLKTNALKGTNARSMRLKGRGSVRRCSVLVRVRSLFHLGDLRDGNAIRKPTHLLNALLYVTVS